MSPLFYGISEFSPVCMAKLESKVSSRNKIVPILWPVTSTALAKAAAHPAQVCLGHWDVCMSNLSSLIANGLTNTKSNIGRLRTKDQRSVQQMGCN